MPGTLTLSELKKSSNNKNNYYYCDDKPKLKNNIMGLLCWGTNLGYDKLPVEQISRFYNVLLMKSECKVYRPSCYGEMPSMPRRPEVMPPG